MSNRNRLLAFGDVLMPSEAAEPILAKPVRGALMEWLTEFWSEKELLAVGLTARRRAIFDGPPGVGKSTLAHHLSARLGLPMLVVRPERLIDKYIGSTGQNIGALFDAADSPDDPVMLFLDEFDVLATKRRDAESSGSEERNSFVNVLLQCIDRHKGFIVAATNFGDRIDPAIWRRFDIHITLELPGPFERERILARYLAPYGLPRSALGQLAEACATASPSLMRQLCEGLKRQLIIGPKVGWDMDREAVVGRLLAAIQPHRDLGRPRLWSLGAKDQAVSMMPWPLPLVADLPVDPPADSGPPRGGSVVPLRGKRGEA
jgi:MoxR-like ATPase